ncbi:MAG: intracellular sulfur oxidation DsrE/DsrF family protein [Oleispira sp.]|jgi:intracellular sulfur oxidation DsrE/DsrF family protein
MLDKLSFICVLMLNGLFVNAASAQNVVIQPAVQTQSIASISATDSVVKEAATEFQKLQANVALHTLSELKQLLDQAETIANGESQYNTEEPISVVLHGEEIKAFVRSNYRSNKALVDLAARLDAFNIIDVKVCKRWMGANGVMASELPPFVEAVPFGVGERERLKKAGYAYF